MSAYGDFASLYDELMNDIDYEKWYTYITEVFKRHGTSPSSVLEMACGTGNLTEFFCKAGLDVTCFDLSEEMLTVASEKLGGYKNVTILRQDMTNFRLTEKFDSVVSACDSINYILSVEELEIVFKNVYEHLNPGGVFVFDINSYFKLSHIIGDNTFIEDTEDIFYIWDNEFIEEEKICNFYLTFFVREEDKYKRFDEFHKEKAYRKDEVVDTLKAVGFTDINSYDEFSFLEVREDTERIFFAAVKPIKS